MSSIPITIDGRQVEVEEGSTILQAARQHAIDIPTLCDFPPLPSHGSCRMCVVEIQGRANTPTACTTPVEAGMVVQTQTPSLKSLRIDLLRMLLAEHPSACLFCAENSTCQDCMVTLKKAGVTTGCRSCPKDGQCELQNLVVRFGLGGESGYPVRYRMLAVEKGDPFFDRDYNLCILCGRCVRVCNELHFSSVLTNNQRGSEALVGTAFGRSHIEAGCTFCGACVQACPTGALSEKTRKWDGKADREALTTCPFCSIGCQITLQIKQDRLMGALAVSIPERAGLCVLGRFGIPEVVNQPTRLLHPQKTAGSIPVPISWDEAMQRTVERLAACPPEAFRMSISANSSSEDLYIAQKFTRLVMHSNAIHTPEAEAYGDGLGAVVNLIKRSSALSSLETAEAVLCMGLDGKYAQSVVEVLLKKAKRHGAKLVTLHSGGNSLTSYADIWLKSDPEYEAQLLDHLVGLARQDKTNLLPEGIIPESEIANLSLAAQALTSARTPTIVIGPATLAGENNRRCLAVVEQLAETLAARVVVLAAQNNLGGVLLMGALPGILPGGGDTNNPVEREKIACLWGATVPEYLPEQNQTKAEVVYRIGQGVLPEPGQAAFTIYQNFVQPPLDSLADLTLPAAAFGEWNGTAIDYAGRVRSLKGVVAPTGESKPTWQILCSIARMIGVSGFDFNNDDEIRAEIAGIVKGYVANQVLDLASFFTVIPETLAKQPGVSIPKNEPFYLGFPLASWVEGLKSLHPEEYHG